MHDVLRELTGSGDDPGAVVDALRAAGHDLPGDLVVEAVASFTDTAPAAVAEHLSAFTTAYGPEGFVDPADLDAAALVPDGLALLASAPGPGPDGAAPADDGAPRDDETAESDEALAFGAGAGTRDDGVVTPGDEAGPDEPAGEVPDAEIPGEMPDAEMTGAGLTDVPLLPHDSEGSSPGDLGSHAPDETFDPADLDAPDTEDLDFPL
ncbi:hypothetical protein GCM10028784_17020 [Myceligenerans cantabricum]